MPRRRTRLRRLSQRRPKLASGPLRRLGPGKWRTRDGRWTILRHESDPAPKRWFIYERDEEWPAWDAGALSLAEAIEQIEGLEAP